MLPRERVEGAEIMGQVWLHRQVGSRHLQIPRDVVIHLPPDYDTQPARRYPVLYMHDGQNLFDVRTSAFGMKWDLDGHAQRLAEAQDIEPTIVVGVYNTPARVAEYTPDWSDAPGSGRLDAYARFLIEELKPAVDATWRTLPSREHTAVGGSSLGGLAALYLVLRFAHVFGRGAAVSPSLWFGGGRMLREIHDTSQLVLPWRLWISAGTLEGRRPGTSFSHAIAGLRRLRDLLEAKGMRSGVDLFCHEAEGGRHDEASWSSQVPDMLRSLFPHGLHRSSRG